MFWAGFGKVVCAGRTWPNVPKAEAGTLRLQVSVKCELAASHMTDRTTHPNRHIRTNDTHKRGPNAIGQPHLTNQRMAWLPGLSRKVRSGQRRWVFRTLKRCC
jgi:hypothetical protein